MRPPSAEPIATRSPNPSAAISSSIIRFTLIPAVVVGLLTDDQSEEGSGLASLRSRSMSPMLREPDPVRVHNTSTVSSVST